ncbi:hypothetical protein QWZ06_10485 [Chryseobacterium tructae]|uniref:hypothetical protein n=1 Tax=Chryseobacterium tructae TaxID=1037380 RepID=UPI0025B4BDDB|nr:hypothetical protein [Chryseobacterium tructae]MDN3692674.1 hypothetical protein [Chryseobacterium tructae]
MNRRELLKSGLLAGTLSLVPFSNVFAKTKTISEKTGDDLSGFKKINLGELELFILTDGYIHEKDLNSFAPRGNISELKPSLKTTSGQIPILIWQSIFCLLKQKKS